MFKSRGLTSVISAFTVLEQKFILEVAQSLIENGYPAHQLTRVYLQKRIENLTDYYNYNEVTFLINPSVYNKEVNNLGVENIGVGWENPAVTRLPDGGIEFELGRKTKVEELEIFLYRLNDSYAYDGLFEEQDSVLEKIDNLLKAAIIVDKSVKFISKGLFELSENHHIIICWLAENVYKVSMRSLEHSMLNKNYFHEMINYESKFTVNLTNGEVELIDRFMLNFYPTPVTMPEIFRKPKPLDDSHLYS